MMTREGFYGWCSYTEGDEIAANMPKPVRPLLWDEAFDLARRAMPDETFGVLNMVADGLYKRSREG